MEPGIHSQNEFNGESFVSEVSVDSKKVPTGLRKNSLSRARLDVSVNRRTDVLWQETPARVLAYKASAVHQYGWIPFNPFKWRNVKATVFSSVLLNVQTVLLVGWAVIIHATGLGMPEYDIRAFLKIWGTVYAGAVFNLATVVVFILGLFISLVINRWWSIRTAYAKFVSACSDLTMMSAVNVRRDAQESHGARARASRARLELVRLINLTHVLVCIMADGANTVYARSSLEIWWDRLRDKKTSVEGDQAFGRASMHTLGYQELCEEGLVNEDEWETILANETFGMPRYMTVMYWVEALLHKCKEEGALNATQQGMQAMTAKVGAISDSATSIFTLIRSQMPYPYVHLVSFTVHFYLFFWATYVGCLLRVGIPDGSVSQSGTTGPLDVPKGVSADDAWAQLSELDSVTTNVRHAHRADGWFNLAWAYITIAFANAVFQGLLNIHVLLDNPYGDHCTKFPLRAQIVELLNASRTMLSFTDQLPSVVADIFAGRDTHPRVAEMPIETCTETASLARPGTEGDGTSAPVPATPRTLGAVGASLGPVHATPQDLGNMSERTLNQVAEAIIHASRRHPRASSASRPVKTAALRLQQQQAEGPHRSFAALQALPTGDVPRTTNWAAASPVDMDIDESPMEHLFMLRARSIGSMSPYAPTNSTSAPNSPRAHPQARHTRNRSAAQQHSSRSGAIRKGMLSRVSAPFRLVRSPPGPSSPSSSQSHSHRHSQTLPRVASKPQTSPRGHSSHVRFMDDATLTPRGGTTVQEDDDSDMLPDGTEAVTSILPTSSNPSPRSHVRTKNLPDGSTSAAPSVEGDTAFTSRLMAVQSPERFNFASDTSMLGQHATHSAAAPAHAATAAMVGHAALQFGGGVPGQLYKHGSTETNASSIAPQSQGVPPPCKSRDSDVSDSPLARPEALTLLHSGAQPGDVPSGSRDTQALGGLLGSDNGDSLTLNMPTGMPGVSVSSHVLEHVASSQMSIPSAPSASSSNSEQRNKSTAPAAQSSVAATQPVGPTRSRRGFPPPVPLPKTQAQPNPAAAATAGSTLQPNEAENVSLAPQSGPGLSIGGPGVQQNGSQAEHTTDSRPTGTTGGRRWFRMFGTPAKGGLDGSRQKLNGGTQSAFTPEVAPQEHQQPQKRLSGTSVAGPGAEDLRPSNGPGHGQAEDLRRISSEVALRRVGPHAVFNPTTIMSPGDAKFLDAVQLQRRESSVGPEATSSNAQGTQQRMHDSPPRPGGGNTAILQRSAQQEPLQTPAIGPSMLAKVEESPREKQSGHSTQQDHSSDPGSRGVTDCASSAELASGNRHVFKM